MKQYEPIELVDKRALCTARYVSEVVFARFVTLAGLQDIIPYENFRVLPYMVEWGHAQMNLGWPLRKPGTNSGLPADYWKDEPQR